MVDPQVFEVELREQTAAVLRALAQRNGDALCAPFAALAAAVYLGQSVAHVADFRMRLGCALVTATREIAPELVADIVPPSGGLSH